MERMVYELMKLKNNFNKLPKVTDKDEENFRKADKCHICDKAYTDKDIRVRNHCHWKVQRFGPSRLQS